MEKRKMLTGMDRFLDLSWVFQSDTLRILSPGPQFKLSEVGVQSAGMVGDIMMLYQRSKQPVLTEYWVLSTEY
jgi:hypothetical protein